MIKTAEVPSVYWESLFFSAKRNCADSKKVTFKK